MIDGIATTQSEVSLNTVTSHNKMELDTLAEPDNLAPGDNQADESDLPIRDWAAAVGSYDARTNSQPGRTPDLKLLTKEAGL